MSITALYTALIDDAALFPPGSAPMPEAVTSHLGHRRAWYAPLVGPFVCPATRLDELAAHLDFGSGPLGVTVVVDTGVGGIGPAVDVVAADDRMILRGIEVPLRGEPLTDPARRTLAALDAAVGGPDEEEPAYVEVPRQMGWREALEIVADSGYRAKLRTGGATPDAFPPDGHVASFILACLDLDTPFKFTAGLHRAVRHTSSDGVEQHGFLNALAGVAVGIDGGGDVDVARTVGDRDSAAVADLVRGLPAATAARVRTWFTSYGSCSIAEPVDDLLALGLVSKE
ncbi:MAG TPA: hypothetical protein VJ644_03995 [Jiangellaceae bacterium]|nr:hypothetical protein [Jiangellaceae bacterium]